jgi:predicted metal-binding membrane protein
MQQPASRVSPLTRPASVTIVAALLVCAGVAWVITVRQAGAMGMGGMAMMNASLFLITWIVMMVAMMFPSIAPMTVAFASVTRSRGEGYAPTALFVLGYIAVWAISGLVPLAVAQAVNQLWMTPPSWLPRVGGAVIVLAGIYQFTPLKDTCLRACRSPLGFIIAHNFGAGTPAALRAGASHGLYCLGCCWALMAVLAVIGLMNVAWMAVIAAVFFVEKNVRRGELLPKAVGAACVVAGLAVVAWPGLLAGSSAI